MMENSSDSSSEELFNNLIDDSDDDRAFISKFMEIQRLENEAIVLATRIAQFKQQSTASSSRTPRRRKKIFIDRNRDEAHERLYQDYFVNDPLYTEDQFRRRFRMRRHLFLRIVNALEAHDEYFTIRYNAAGRRGLTPLVKCTAAIRQLAYGISADCVDEYLKIGESTTLECMKRFCEDIIEVFGSEYLRRPTQADVDRLLAIAQARGFPGMFGSIDCMHWTWKNCPVAWKQSFEKGLYKVPTIILEAVASHDLWI